MAKLLRGMSVLLLFTAVGCSSSPAPGDKLLVTTPDHIWYEKADLLKYWETLSSSKDSIGMLTEGSKGGSLHDGSTIQVLEVLEDAIRVRVIEDSASSGVKSAFGDQTGKIGFVSVRFKGVKVTQ